MSPDDVVLALRSAADAAGFSYNGAKVTIQGDEVAISFHKKLGEVLHTSGVTTGGTISARRTINDLAKIAVMRAIEFWGRAEREYNDDVAVNNGAEPMLAAESRMRPPGEWLEDRTPPQTGV